MAYWQKKFKPFCHYAKLKSNAYLSSVHKREYVFALKEGENFNPSERDRWIQKSGALTLYGWTLPNLNDGCGCRPGEISFGVCSAEFHWAGRLKEDGKSLELGLTFCSSDIGLRGPVIWRNFRRDTSGAAEEN